MPWPARPASGRGARVGPGSVSCVCGHWMDRSSPAALRSYSRKRRSRPAHSPYGAATEKMRRMADLIAIAEARRRVLEAVRPLPAEPVAACRGARHGCSPRTCAARSSVPPFDSSAMDGYAVVAGPAAELEVVGEARAGHPAQVTVGPGAAIAISTGAAVPEGATAVVPVERTERVERRRARARHRARRQHPPRRRGHRRRRRGAALRRTRSAPAALGVAASVGRASLSCARRPRVALLRDRRRADRAGAAAPAGRHLQLERLRAGRARSSGRAPSSSRASACRDSADATRAALGAALDAADVVVVSGGVSVGPHDHVKGALADARRRGALLGRAACARASRSGSARAATRSPSACPAIRSRRWSPSSCSCGPPWRRSRAPTRRPPAPRARARRAGRAQPAPRAGGARAAEGRRRTAGAPSPTKGAQGSHVLTSMLGADALALIAPGEGEAPAGERVEVELL